MGQYLRTVVSPLIVVAFIGVLIAGPLRAVKARAAATCATDPASRFLEQLQRDAYGIDIYWLGELDRRRETAARIAREFPEGTPGFPSPNLKAALRGLRMPTCYEDPLWFNALQSMFALLHDVAGDVVPSARRPKDLVFGTVPSTTVNAVTYHIAPGGSVVVFNNSLLNFAVFESNAAVAAVAAEGAAIGPESPSRRESTHAAVDAQRASVAMKSLLLDFLSLPGARDERSHYLNEDYGMQIAPFMSGMVAFAAAHEYAHVLLGHRTVQPDLTSTGPTASALTVATRSWPQETSADELAVRLIDAMVRRKQFLTTRWRDQWPAVLRAAPVFLQYFDMIEESTMWRDRKPNDRPLGEHEKDTIRALSVGGAVTAEDAARIGILGDHPPAWARKERVTAQVNSLVLARTSTNAERRAEALAEQVLGSIERHWKENRSDVQRIVASVVRGEPIEVALLAGLRVSIDPARWSETWSDSPRTRTFRHSNRDALFSVAWTDQHLTSQWLADFEIDQLRAKVPDVMRRQAGHRIINDRDFDVRLLEGTVGAARTTWLYYDLVMPEGAVEFVVMTESPSVESRRSDMEGLIATVH
jgi:hypothetical protein